MQIVALLFDIHPDTSTVALPGPLVVVSLHCRHFFGALETERRE